MSAVVKGMARQSALVHYFFRLFLWGLFRSSQLLLLLSPAELLEELGRASRAEKSVCVAVCTSAGAESSSIAVSLASKYFLEFLKGTWGLRVPGFF